MIVDGRSRRPNCTVPLIFDKDVEAGNQLPTGPGAMP